MWTDNRSSVAPFIHLDLHLPVAYHQLFCNHQDQHTAMDPTKDRQSLLFFSNAFSSSINVHITMPLRACEAGAGDTPRSVWG